MKVVVPYGAGGVTDTMARLTADRLTKALGQSFIIENKVGAGGAIGIDYAMSLPRDGYTILFVGSTLFTVLPLAAKVNYEPLKDLVPVSITGTNGMVMVVPKDSPFKTLKELVDYARANPGKITYSTGGPATNNHLATAYFAGREKLDMVHVPFKGGQPALTAVMSKSVDMLFSNSSDLIEPAKAGTVRAIAVSTPKRMPQLPDVPTVAETYPGYEYVAWNGYAVMGGVPEEVKKRLAEALAPITRDAAGRGDRSTSWASTRSARRRRRRSIRSARTCRSTRRSWTSLASDSTRSSRRNEAGFAIAKWPGQCPGHFCFVSCRRSGLRLRLRLHRARHPDAGGCLPAGGTADERGCCGSITDSRFGFLPTSRSLISSPVSVSNSSRPLASVSRSARLASSIWRASSWPSSTSRRISASIFCAVASETFCVRATDMPRNTSSWFSP